MAYDPLSSISKIQRLTGNENIVLTQGETPTGNGRYPLEQLKKELGNKSLLGSVTPLTSDIEQGVYIASEVGVYTNFGNIEVTQEDFDNGLVLLTKNNDGTFSKDLVPMPGVLTDNDINVEGGVTGFNPIGEVKEGDSRAVSGDEVYDKVALKNDLLVDNWEDITGVVTNDLRPRSTTGVLEVTDGYKCTDYIPCSIGDEFQIDGWSFSSTSALILTYDETQTRIVDINRGTGTAQYFDNYSFVPNFNGYFIVTGREGNVYKCNVRKKIQSPKYAEVTEVDGEIEAVNERINNLPVGSKYGIRFDVNSDLSACERIFDSVGKTATAKVSNSAVNSDFNNIYPWSEIKRVNIKVLPNGAKKLTYENESGFTVDGSNGDVFVEIPKFYFERYIQDGYDYRVISQFGKELHPAFIEDGKIVDKIYVSAYESSLISNEMRSISGVMPWNNIVAETMLNKVKEKGQGFTLYDLRTIDAIQNLMYIEFANRNSSAILGQGLADFSQPGSTSYKYSTLSETNTNRIVMDYTGVADLTVTNERERLSVGSNILVCDNTPENIITYAKVTNNTFVDGILTIEFDGNPIDTTTNYYIGNSPQDTGLCDALGYHTGRLNRPKQFPESTISERMRNSIKYRGIENISGNVWHYLPDVTFVDGVPYVCNSIKDYEFFKVTDSYRPIALELPIQNVNTADKWLLTASFDHFCKYQFGTTFGTSTWSQRFGAYYYMGEDTNVIANGGGFDHRERCNIATHRAWINPTRQWYLYGCRMIFKNI